MQKSINDFEFVLGILEKSYYKTKSPSVTLIAETTKNPFNVLLSTLISFRTKDEVTIKASRKLFESIKNFKDILLLDEKEIEKLIYPSGFYKTKAKRMKEISQIIEDNFHGKVPDTIEELLKLPGVGRKTANLVIILGYGKDGICVDTHVHRISNRFGWVKTKTPEQTEFALRDFLPLKYWRKINDYLVSYGQMICKPVSPLCSKCGLNEVCPKFSVSKSR